jgi:pimeloyl-ACP methyl ester carboxylesterase
MPERSMTSLPRWLPAGGLLAAALALAPPAAAQGLQLSACQLPHPLHLTVVSAECGVLEVPENPAAPEGRRIALHLARVPAINRRRPEDALFVLAGGPGQGAADFFVALSGAFERIHRDRDVILLDQRGTGGSQPLDCPESEAQLYQSSEAEVTAFAAGCLAQLRTHTDPAYYTTSVAVADLERARAALGYPRIDLYGISYGTRVAQHYLRRYPARVRALILDGVVPPTLALGADVAPAAEAALRRILARCVAQSACLARFHTPLEDYEAVSRTLRAQPVEVSVADPANAVPRRVRFDRDHLATVLRLGSYNADYAALLPLFLNAGAHGDYVPLAAQSLYLERSVESVAIGMHNSVVCSEDVPYWKAQDLNRAVLDATFMGSAEVDALQALCRSWPRGPVDADFHEALRSDVPALFLSGGDDPVTPPAYAHLAAAGFSAARELSLPGFGHGVLTVPCMERLLAQFLARPEPAALDVSCLRTAAPLPFFTSVNGPAP